MTRCGCEKEGARQSEFSPGTVDCDEMIVYALVNPDTTSVKQISKSKLKQSNLSVCRAGYTSGVDAHASIVKVLLQKNSERVEEGFFYAPCSEIRAIVLGEGDHGAFCVIDDALEGFSSHAHVGYSEPSNALLKNHREAARGNLLLTFQARGVQKKWSGDPFLVET